MAAPRFQDSIFYPKNQKTGNSVHHFLQFHVVRWPNVEPTDLHFRMNHARVTQEHREASLDVLHERCSRSLGKARAGRWIADRFLSTSRIKQQIIA